MGMRIGIGLTGFSYYEGDDKVPNLLSPLAAYIPSRRGKSTYDADGWPVTIDDSTWDDWSFIPAWNWWTPPGRYRIDAIGSGKFSVYHPDLPGGGVTIDFHAPTPGARTVGGEYDLGSRAGGIAGILSTDPADHLRDVRIYRTNVDPTKTFTPEYVSDVSNFAAFRTSAWPAMLARDTVTWSDDPRNPDTRKWLAAIELANLTGRELWIQFPYSADDNYVKGMARLFKNNLKAGIPVNAEESNEIWNWFGPFGAGTAWVDNWRKANMGDKYTLSQAYVYRAAHHMDVFSAEAPDVKLVRVISFQHMDIQGFKDAIAFMGGTPGQITFASGIDPVPDGGLKFDALSTAPYADTQTRVDWGKADALMQSDVAGDKDKAYQLVFDGYYASIEDNERMSLAYRTLAAPLGLRMFVYECAPGLSFDPTGLPPYRDELLKATYDDPRMQQFLTEAYYPYLEKYYELIMYTQHADLPTPGKYWGIKKNLYDNTSPKWLATIDWIKNHQGEPMKSVLISDGGFETVKVGAGQFKYVPAGSPWTFVGNAGIAANGSGFTSANPAAPDGTQVAFLQMNGSMSASFTTTGEPSQILFEAAQRATFQAAKQDVEVIVDNVSVGKFTPLGRDFQSFATAPFRGTTHKVVFKGLNTAGGDNTILIDKVSVAPTTVTPTPTPTPPPAPTAPTGLAVSATSPTATTISWGAVSAATGYSLQRSPDGNTWTEIAKPAKDVLTYADSGLTPSTAYSYRVSAIGTGGASPYSVAVNVTTPAPAPVAPTAPTGLTAKATSPTAVSLSWSAVPVATSYSLQRSPDGTAWAEVAKPSKDVLTFADSGLTPSTAYNYRVAAVGDGGTSPYSPSVMVTTPAPLPPPPDIAAESADLSARAAAVGAKLAELSPLVDAMKAAATKLADDAAAVNKP